MTQHASRHSPQADSTRDQGQTPPSPRPVTGDIDDWVPEDKAPSTAENNFMSFSLFSFLIIFGLGCFILL